MTTLGSNAKQLSNITNKKWEYLLVVNVYELQSEYSTSIPSAQNII